MPHSFPVDPDNTSRARRRARSQQAEQVEVKSLGARIGDVRFDPNAEDGDGDGLVQDNTIYERPGLPKIPQATTGALARTREGELKPQSALTPEEVIDIERARQERTAVAGLRSSVAKPTGGSVPPITKRTAIDRNLQPAKVRDLMPHPSTPNPSKLNWLAGMSDDEIADAVVPESLEDMAALIIQNSFKKSLLGVEMVPTLVNMTLDAADSLEKLPNTNAQLVARMRSYAYRKYSREGSFSTAELKQELEDFYDTLPDSTDSEALQNIVNAIAAMQAYSDGEDKLESQLEDEYERMLQYLESVEVEEGYDFSPNAIGEAKRIVKEALSTSDAYAWAVRTYGMPAIRVVTPESNKKAKDSGRRADVLNQHAGGWFGHGGEYLHGIAINLAERTTAQNLPSGPVHHVNGSPVGGYPTNPVPSNVSFSQADVLRHEWGHFFFYMATRRGAEELFVNAGWDRAEYQALVKHLKNTYDARKGNLYNNGSELRRQYAVRVGKLITLLEDPTEVAKTGATQKEVDGFILQIANTLLKVSKGSGIFNFDGPLAQGDPRIGQVLTTGRIAPGLSGLNFENPLFNLYAEMDSLNQQRNSPTTLSTYAFSNPQESWAEGIASFFSPLANVRALNTNAKRVDIARALGIDVQNGRHDKPWERRSSGLRSSTAEFDSERGNIPVPIESQPYPTEVGGIRSRVELDKRAQTLGVDISLFNDTSRDDDDVMWATNDWSLSKNERVEAGDAVIVREGEQGPEVLLVTRSKGPFRESLALPGGMREGEEPLDRSATREAMEEVGIDSADAVSARLLGEIETRDWDPRFVEGGRVAGVRMDVADDVMPTVGDDATGFEWVPVSDIAVGKYSIAFGHATWIAEAFRDDKDLYEKLSILAEASRVRNRRIIASVDRERAKKGAKRFGTLPNPNAPYPTVYSERRLGLRSTTQSGVPYSLVLRNDEKLASLITELRQQRDGVKDRIEKLERAREDFKKTGNWNGADIGVALNTGGVPRNIDKEEIGFRNWKDVISEELDAQINRAKTFESQVSQAMDSSIETMRRRRNSPSIVEEFDDIRSDRKTYRGLEAATRDLAGMNEEQRREVFNRNGGSYFASVAEQDPNAPSSKKINLYRTENPAEDWKGLYDGQEDGELVSVLGFTQRGDIDSPTDSAVAPILEGWAKNAVSRDAGLRSSSMVPRREVLTGDIVDFPESQRGGERQERLDTIPEIERFIRQELAIGEAPRERIERLREILESIALADFSAQSIGETMASIRRELSEMVTSGLFNPNRGEDRAYMLYQDAVDVISDILTQAIVRDITDEDKLGEIEFLVDDWSLDLKNRADKMENEIAGAGRGEFGATEAVRGMLSSTGTGNRDFQALVPRVGEAYKEDAEYSAAMAKSLLSPEGIEAIKTTPKMESLKKRLLESIRVEVDENGIPMFFAEPHPVFFDAIPAKLDWERVRTPPRELLDSIVQRLKDSIDTDNDYVVVDLGSQDKYNKLTGELFQELIAPYGEDNENLSRGFDDSSYIGLYAASVVHPQRAIGGALGTSDVTHDAFGHLGTGRGFDRHGEWANLIAMISFVDNPDWDFTEEEKENITRWLFNSYQPRGFDGFGYNLVKETPLNFREIFQSLVDNSFPEQSSSMRSRTAESSAVRVAEAPESLLSDATLDGFVNRRAMRSRTTSVVGKDFNEIAYELELSAREQDIAEDELAGNMEEIATGRIFDRPLHDAIEKDKKRLLESIRVEVSEEDGVPMLIAEPNPLLFQYIPDKRDWSKVMVPKRETVKRAAKYIKERQSEEPTEEELWDMTGPSFTGVTAVDTFTERLRDIVRSFSEGGVQKDEGMEVGDGWLPLYLGGLSNPPSLVDALDSFAEQIHDAFGHAGIGRGFDRHGEWANPLAVISMLDNPMFDDFTPEMKNSVALHMLREFGVVRIEQRYGTGFGEAYDEDMDSGQWQEWLNYYTGDVRELIDILDDSDKTQVLNDDGSRPAGMRSRTGKAPQVISVEDLTEQQVSEIAKNEGMHQKFNAIMSDNAGMLSRSSKDPRSVQQFDKSFKEKYGEEPQYGSGDCFFTAISKAQELAEAYDNVRVVHGVPLGTGGEAEGIRYPHAWVEFTQNIGGRDIEFIADFSNGNEVVVPKELYYKVGNIDPEFNRAYSIDEVEEKIEENGHAGPW